VLLRGLGEWKTGGLVVVGVIVGSGHWYDCSEMAGLG
jgi:hypothetical protein